MKSGPYFIPTAYQISRGSRDDTISLEITAQRYGPPGQRVNLNQKGLKVTDAKILHHQKNKQIEHQVSRINHLPTFEEVRLHTAAPLYPGHYQITLEFKPGNLKALSQLAGKSLATVELRQFFPSFDNPQARTDAELRVS